MDTLKNKTYEKYDYTSRYITVPYYHDIICDREIYGIGSNLNKNTEYVSHKVIQGDTLDKLSLKYYNNPTYWWIIAYFNDIQDPFDELITYYSILKIPRISSIEFGASR